MNQKTRYSIFSMMSSFFLIITAVLMLVGFGDLAAIAFLVFLFSATGMIINHPPAARK